MISEVPWVVFLSETAIKNLNANKNNEASAILQKMGSTSREMIENIHDIVWTVDPNNDDTTSLLERMQTFVKDICASNNIKLNLDMVDFNTQINLSMDVRKNVYLIFKEAVYNSVKHGKTSELSIRFSSEDKNHILEITDTGLGFDTTASNYSGNGLKNLVIRAKEIKGEIEIHSELNKGTHIILRF
jgi:signal transduction histidine kinase